MEILRPFFAVFCQLHKYVLQNWGSDSHFTLESGINVAPWINIAPGKFGKKNQRSLIYTLYLICTYTTILKEALWSPE